MRAETKPRAVRWIKEEVNCLLCGSDERTILYPQLPGVVRCLRCGFVFSSPRITPQEAVELYSQSYFESHSSQEMGYDNYVSDQRLVEKTFNRRLDEIEKKWAQRKGRVLDVGCAAGFFLSVAKKRGWQVEGVEISDYCCRYAAQNFGLKLYCGQFQDHPYTKESFDLISMWDYLEHSFVPDKDIQKAFELLKPGGLIAVATPDLSSLPARYFKNNWIGFKEHEHLYYFTRKNLDRLVSKNGFKVLQTSYAGKYISVDFFAKRAKNYSPWIAGSLNRLSRMASAGDRSFYCNPMDIVYLIARKQG